MTKVQQARHNYHHKSSTVTFLPNTWEHVDSLDLKMLFPTVKVFLDGAKNPPGKMEALD